jgi:hypothetical protein
MTDNFLTIEEKRAWLARIFRDTSGEYTDADKLKALEADTSLAMLTPNRQENLDSSSCQPEVYHWENPKICITCIHYKQNRCNLTAFHFPPEHPACPRYIPKSK